MEFALVVLLLIVVVLGVFLWRRGAIDKKKARDELRDAANHVREDVRNWRDKL